MAGKKDVKLPRFGLIPAYPMWEVAKVYGHGASKYAERNWEHGISFTVSLDALERHIALFKAGQDKDPESEIHHLAHAVFHLFALIQNGRTHPLQDDRSPYYMALNMESEVLVQESKDFGDPERPFLRSGEYCLDDPLNWYGESLLAEQLDEDKKEAWAAFLEDEDIRRACDCWGCLTGIDSRCDWPNCRCEESCLDYAEDGGF